MITANNAEIGSIKLRKIIGDHKSRYISGKMKTHKQGHPIRPITSQIPTPVYRI